MSFRAIKHFIYGREWFGKLGTCEQWLLILLPGWDDATSDVHTHPVCIDKNSFQAGLILLPRHGGAKNTSWAAFVGSGERCQIETAWERARGGFLTQNSSPRLQLQHREGAQCSAALCSGLLIAQCPTASSGPPWPFSWLLSSCLWPLLLRVGVSCSLG